MISVGAGMHLHAMGRCAIDRALCVCEQIGRSVNLQNMTVSHTVGDPLDYSALTNLDFHECAPRHTAHLIIIRRTSHRMAGTRCPTELRRARQDAKCLGFERWRR